VPTRRAATPPILQLAEFVPFRLNRLAAAVSEHLATVYRGRFGLEVPEWRVLVTIGQRSDCTAQQIVASTRMHKTRVSRAVASLLRRALVERAPSRADGRELHLRFTAAGRRLYASLVPLALARERELLTCLGSAQRGAFLRGLAALESTLALGRE